jgi:hypothetical protein
VSRVPAPFTADLCGYRLDRSGKITGNPNNSDSNDDQSVYLGVALFDRLGVPRGKVAPPNPGDDLEELIVRDLKALRPDLRIARSRPATDFVQYAHLVRYQSGSGQQS